MATREDLEDALVVAHNSGDFEAANVLASMVKNGEFDDTTFLGSVGEAGKRLVGGLATGTARVGTGLAELIPGIDDEAAREVQSDFDAFVADTLGYDPAYDDNYGPQLGGVLGEMGPMVLSLFLPVGLPGRGT